MKRISCIILLVIIITFTLSATIFAQQEVTIKVDGSSLELDVRPFIENGKTLAPIAGVFEKIGAKVTWDKPNNKVYVEDAYMKIELVIDQCKALIYRKYDFTGIPEEVTLKTAPKILNDNAFIPVRFVAESLGAEVKWDAATSTVLIKTKADIIPVEKPILFEKITAQNFKDDKQLIQWYEANYKEAGIYYKKVQTDVYVLVSAGQKPTGGYTIEVEDVTMVSPGKVYVSAKVTSPSPDMMVTQALTYPHVLIKLQSENITSVQGDINGSSDQLSDKESPVTDKTIKGIGAEIAIEDIKLIELFDLEQNKLKQFDEEEVKEIVVSYNNSQIDDSAFIEMITGNTMIITLNDDSYIRLISYGSKENIVASGETEGEYFTYHLICPEIAKILLQQIIDA